MERHKNKAYILASKQALDSKALPDSTTCTFLSEGSGDVPKGRLFKNSKSSNTIVVFQDPTFVYFKI